MTEPIIGACEWSNLASCPDEPCHHPSPITIHAAACVDAIGGDERIPRAWCPNCGALRVTVLVESRWEAPRQ